MKKIFAEPEFEIINFIEEDVIITSDYTDGNIGEKDEVIAE